MLTFRGLAESWAEMTPDEQQTGENRDAAATYCGQKYGVTNPNFKPCVDFYAGPHIGEYTPTSTTGTSTTPAKKPPSSLLTKFGITTTSNVSSKVGTKLTPGIVGTVSSTLFPANTPWYQTPAGIIALILGGLFAVKKLRG